mmetsp:Transcript_768/g.1220  ORF Transcript_768/g.1220 Transcript_768/m.1220 type:complete len:87 (+) Transcript_768:40-300(+)
MAALPAQMQFSYAISGTTNRNHQTASVIEQHGLAVVVRESRNHLRRNPPSQQDSLSVEKVAAADFAQGPEDPSRRLVLLAAVSRSH